MNPVVNMDTNNSSYDNYYTSVQRFTTDGYYRKEGKNNNNNNNKKNKSSNQITSSSILARILIVDDEPDVNLLLKMILERVNGFKVDSFTDPESALQYFKSGLYDLAILDKKCQR
jgi:PleD family two-component response regulator